MAVKYQGGKSIPLNFPVAGHERAVAQAQRVLEEARKLRQVLLAVGPTMPAHADNSMRAAGFDALAVEKSAQLVLGNLKEIKPR